MSELAEYNPKLTSDLKLQIQRAINSPKAYKRISESPNTFEVKMEEMIKNAYILAGVTVPDDYEMDTVIEQLKEEILQMKGLTAKDVEIIMKQGPLGKLDGIHFKRFSAKLFSEWAKTYWHNLRKQAHLAIAKGIESELRKDEPLPRNYSTAEHLHNYKEWAKQSIQKGQPIVNAKYKAHSIKWFDILKDEIGKVLGDEGRKEWKTYYKEKHSEKLSTEQLLTRYIDLESIKNYAKNSTKRHILWLYTLKNKEL